MSIHINVPRAEIDSAIEKLVSETFAGDFKKDSFSRLNAIITNKTIEIVSTILTEKNPNLQSPKVIVTATTREVLNQESRDEVIQTSVAAKISPKTDGVISFNYKPRPDIDILLTVIYITSIEH
ncbi:uncharacterized protein SAPINGB_P000725 [Magnusiomyces paraingens]|uniref:Topoisomerase I damage affected protein 2 n=1 Tax=Magnusiomyces paraingens TaxID=2606893 RepID=A0A5E8B1T3_9ASCO|nr:uncharacterized protein SAPINGB_P000725 [Saprochaete ingens]VVT45363.1 unnamed protein product [Saprochaete ingens]